jgi:hypothetical protein
VNGKIIAGKVRARPDPLNNSDCVLFKRAAGDRAAQGTKHWLRIIDVNGETTGGFPSNRFISHREAQDARHVGIHDAAHKLDNCL